MKPHNTNTRFYPGDIVDFERPKHGRPTAIWGTETEPKRRAVIMQCNHCQGQVTYSIYMAPGEGMFPHPGFFAWADPRELTLIEPAPVRQYLNLFPGL